jgi:hypothetical protein
MERTNAGHRADHVAGRRELKCLGGDEVEIMKRFSTLNGALALTRVLRLVFKVTPTDPVTLFTFRACC